MQPRKPVAYLSNRELLKHIYESKASYSSLINPAFQDRRYIYPDRIVKSFKDMTEPDTVYKLMTRDHIPPDTKPSFNPYKHFVVIDGQPVEVLRSHWVGGANEGHYQDQHGKLTHGLAERIMRLVSNFAKKSNWRGYSYVEEMQGQALMQLCQVALQFDESKATQAPNPFAYFTAVATNSFRKILNAEKKVQNTRDDMLEAHGQMPSHTRQAENEAAQRGEPPASPPPTPKRGWGKKVTKGLT